MIGGAPDNRQQARSMAAVGRSTRSGSSMPSRAGSAARRCRRGLLELKLTERMLMDDLADVKQRLMRLKALGLRISVDDFGTGYSSLGHLKELPIDKVKIDRSFIHDLPANRDSAAITRASSR